MTFDTASRSIVSVARADFGSFTAAQGADFIGANCGIGLAKMLNSVLGILAQAYDIPVVAKRNCGIPAYVDGAIHYHGTLYSMAEYALLARGVGAKIISSCCGTSPAHVAAMLSVLNGMAGGGSWVSGQVIG